MSATTSRRRRVTKADIAETEGPETMTVTGETPGEEIQESFLPEGAVEAEAEATTEQEAPKSARVRRAAATGTPEAKPERVRRGPAKEPKELAPLAKEINVRLEKASKLESDAEDHRVAAALRLAEAKEICKRSGVNFQTWTESNVKEINGRQVGYQVIRKLAALGEKEDPKAELDRVRERQAEHAKANREKVKGETRELKEKAERLPDPDAQTPEVNPAPEQDTSLRDRVDVMFQRMEAEDQKEFYINAFDYFGAEEQLDIIRRLAAMIGGDVVFS